MGADKPLTADENKKRIDEGLAKGKTFYLSGGKKIVGGKVEKSKATIPAPPQAAKPPVPAQKDTETKEADKK